jgi:hypothetical protein
VTGSGQTLAIKKASRGCHAGIYDINLFPGIKNIGRIVRNSRKRIMNTADSIADIQKACKKVFTSAMSVQHRQCGAMMLFPPRGKMID